MKDGVVSLDREIEAFGRDLLLATEEEKKLKIQLHELNMVSAMFRNSDMHVTIPVHLGEMPLIGRLLTAILPKDAVRTSLPAATLLSCLTADLKKRTALVIVKRKKIEKQISALGKRRHAERARRAEVWSRED